MTHNLQNKCFLTQAHPSGAIIKSICIFLFLIFSFSLSYSQQPILEWVRSYNSPDNEGDHFTDFVLDNAGNVYETGWNTTQSEYNNIITVKYNSVGVLLWAVSYNGKGNPNDISTGIAVDSIGNCYVAGYSGFNFGPYDGILIKYNNSGDTLWTRKLASNLDEEFTSIAVDLNNFIYVTGSSGDSAVVIKYDPEGNILWRTSYREPPFDIISGDKIEIDRFNNLLIGGTKQIFSNLFSRDLLVRKYSQNGNFIWASTYGNPTNVADWMTGFVIDNSGNCYATGFSEVNGRDILTVKFNSNGTLSWAKYYNNTSNTTDQSNSIICDSSGNNIFIAGSTFVSGYSTNYITIKYNSFGDTQWVKTYNGPGNYQDNAESISIDKLLNVYITGSSYFTNTDFNVATIKYSIDGYQKWITRWGDGGDGGSKILVDNNLNIYIGGGEGVAGPNFLDLLAIKYSQIVGINNISNIIPDKYQLFQNFPNPFNPVTSIRFNINKYGLTKLDIFNPLGKKITTLVNQILYPGEYEIKWNADNNASGVYFYNLENENFKETKKMMLIK